MFVDESVFRKKIEQTVSIDPAHDLAHFMRVVKTAKELCEVEHARLEIVVPAAWLHDLVNVPKNDPRRKQASQLSAEAAAQFLTEINYPKEFHNDIAHAIEAHSYSAAIPARTLEAKIVQDADRLDGVGAVGIARCFTVGALLQRPFYCAEEPFAEARKLDDAVYTLDHFYVKLFNTIESLQTQAGRAEGRRRAQCMQSFLAEFRRELLG